MPSEDNANVPVIPPVFFGLALAAGFLLKRLFPVPLVPPAFERSADLAGFAISLLGLAFGGWALVTFLSARTTPHPNHPASALVTSGPYRVSRNPMYVGLSLALSGIALIANTPWILATLPPVWFALRRLVIGPEEAYLERRFGDEYQAFRARTRRWL